MIVINKIHINFIITRKYSIKKFKLKIPKYIIQIRYV